MTAMVFAPRRLACISASLAEALPNGSPRDMMTLKPSSRRPAGASDNAPSESAALARTPVTAANNNQSVRRIAHVLQRWRSAPLERLQVIAHCKCQRHWIERL